MTEYTLLRSFLMFVWKLETIFAESSKKPGVYDNRNERPKGTVSNY